MTSSKESISTDLTHMTSGISTNMLHTSLSYCSEIATCYDLMGISTEPSLVTLVAGDSLTALTAYKKSDIPDLYTVTEKSETSNLIKSSGIVYIPEPPPLSPGVGAKTSCNNVSIVPKINVMNILSNIQPNRAETEPIINVLHIQSWSIENDTTSVHMSILPVPVTTTHPLIGMDIIVTSSVTIELNLPIPGPQ